MFDGFPRPTKDTSNTSTCIAGTTFIITTVSAKTTTSTIPIKQFEIKLRLGGTLTVSFSLQSGTAGNLSYGQIYVNDIPRGILRSTTSTSYTAFAEDITRLNANDLVQLYVYNSAGTLAYCSSFKLGIDPTTIGSITL